MRLGSRRYDNEVLVSEELALVSKQTWFPLLIQVCLIRTTLLLLTSSVFGVSAYCKNRVASLTFSMAWTKSASAVSLPVLS